MSESFEYIIRTYQVPACIGRRVRVNGKPGTIVADRGNYMGVNFDADKPQQVRLCHPTSEVEYLPSVAKPRKPSRGARRYQDWLRSESSLPFIDWIEWSRLKAKEDKL